MREHELDSPPWLRVDGTLMAVARRLRQAFDQRFEEFGLNVSQASVLAYVVESGPMSQTHAADRLGMGRAATGTLVDRLETLHLIERQPDPEDRRVWMLVPTDTGKELYARILAADEVLRHELRDGISREDRQALADLLNRLQVNISQILDDTD